MNGSVKAYNELTTALLTPEEREKFEWAIGAVLTGGPPNVVVIRGPRGTGKSTLLAIVRNILTRFVGDVSPRVAFYEGVAFRTSMLSDAGSDAFVFIETNRPIDVGDAVFIDPTGDRIPANKYYVLTNEIDSELDSIAELCIDKYHELGHDLP